MRRGVFAGAGVALMFALAGCATNGDIEKINSRLDALDQRVAGVETAARKSAETAYQSTNGI